MSSSANPDPSAETGPLLVHPGADDDDAATTTTTPTAGSPAVTSARDFRRDSWAWKVLQSSFGPYWVVGSSLLMMLITEEAKAMLIARSGFKLVDSAGQPCAKEGHGCFKHPKDSVLFGSMSYEAFLHLLTILSIVAFGFFAFWFAVVGDYGNGRKIVTLVCCVSGSVCMFCPLLFEATPAQYWVSGVSFVVTQLLFSTGQMFANAFLASIVRGHLPIGEGSRATANTLSSTADMMGQVLTAVVQGSCAVALSLNQSEQSWVARACCAVMGGGTLAMTAGALYCLQAYPGPSMRTDASIFRLSINSWKDTFTLRHQLPEFFKFLLSMCLLQDACSTIAIGMSVVAVSDLGMSFTELSYALCYFVAASFLADVVAFFMVKKQFVSEKGVVMATNVAMMLVPVLMLATITTKPQMYALWGLAGFLQASVWVYGLSINSQLMPCGKESQLFAVSQITSNGTAWLAPFLIIAIMQVSSATYRQAFCSVLFFFVTGLVALGRTDVKQGVEDARVYRGKTA